MKTRYVSEYYDPKIDAAKDNPHELDAIFEKAKNDPVLDAQGFWYITLRIDNLLNAYLKKDNRRMFEEGVVKCETRMDVIKGLAALALNDLFTKDEKDELSKMFFDKLKEIEDDGQSKTTN